METEHNVVPIAHFDTRLIESSLRVEAWHQNMGVLFDLAAPDGEFIEDQLQARISVSSLGETVFGITEATSQRFTRDAARVARENVDHILLQLFLKGGGRTSEGVLIQAGDMLVIDLDRPHSMLNTDFSNLTLVLPRDLHPGLTDLLSRLHGQRLAGADPTVRHMANHLYSLWQNIEHMKECDAHIALTGSLNLLEYWLSASDTGRHADDGTSEALTKVIKRYIEHHLGVRLDPGMLAANFRISRSQLYRLFEDEGGVARYIWDRRLRRAMRLVSDPANRRTSVLALALECGFKSEAHFSRSFRARYGMPPGKVRSQVASESRASTTRRSDPRPVYRTDLADLIRQLSP